MKRPLGTVLALILVAAIVAFFAAPAVAFLGVRSAAESDDVEALGRLVDYGALREGLRPQLADGPTPAPAPGFLENPVEAVRRRLAEARPAPGPGVDTLLTPAAISGLLRGEGRAAALRSGPNPPPPPTGASPWPKPVYWSFNRARFAIDADGGRTVFSFQRTGPYDWRLTHIGLPDTPPRPVEATPAG
jgi:hypothetical protein